MAVQGYVKVEQGTAVVWGHPGGSGVTKDLSLNNLGIDAGRMGVYADLGSTFEEEHAVFLWVESGTAPSAGKTVQLFLAASHTASNWAGGVSGADAAYKAAEEDEWKKQLGPPVVTLIATNDANTIMYQAPRLWRPPAQYVAPMVLNKLGVAVRNQGTPADNGSRVILVPRRYLQQDAA